MEFLKKVGIVGVVSATVIGAGFGLSSKTSADFDLAGLDTQVQQQQVQLDNVSAKVDNHEQRITSLENNATPNTQPVQPAPVSAVTPPATPVSAPTVVATPTTKTIVQSFKSSEINMGSDSSSTVWCNYKYDDGTSDKVVVVDPVACQPVGTVVPR